MVFRPKTQFEWKTEDICMSGYQRQNGDIVELTAAGMEAVKSHKNNYADSTKPLAVVSSNL